MGVKLLADSTLLCIVSADGDSLLCNDSLVISLQTVTHSQNMEIFWWSSFVTMVLPVLCAVVIICIFKTNWVEKSKVKNDITRTDGSDDEASDKGSDGNKPSKEIKEATQEKDEGSDDDKSDNSSNEIELNRINKRATKTKATTVPEKDRVEKDTREKEKMEEIEKMDMAEEKDKETEAKET